MLQDYFCACSILMLIMPNLASDIPTLRTVGICYLPVQNCYLSTYNFGNNVGYLMIESLSV